MFILYFVPILYYYVRHVIDLARTSIQIYEKTLIRLRKKRGAIEAKTGQDVTYDDVINHLLDKDRKK